MYTNPKDSAQSIMDSDYKSNSLAPQSETLPNYQPLQELKDIIQQGRNEKAAERIQEPNDRVEEAMWSNTPAGMWLQIVLLLGASMLYLMRVYEITMVGDVLNGWLVPPECIVMSVVVSLRLLPAGRH